MRNKLEQWVRKWEAQGYADGIPDAAPPRLEQANKVPSYRAACLAILKNDIHLVSLGFSRPKCGAYMALKKIEIEGRIK